MRWQLQIPIGELKGGRLSWGPNFRDPDIGAAVVRKTRFWNLCGVLQGGIANRECVPKGSPEVPAAPSPPPPGRTIVLLRSCASYGPYRSFE